MKKKINLSKEDLNVNIVEIDKLLTKKGMSQIGGGKIEMPKWGNSNYAESTRPVQR